FSTLLFSQSIPTTIHAVDTEPNFEVVATGENGSIELTIEDQKIQVEQNKPYSSYVEAGKEVSFQITSKTSIDSIKKNEQDLEGFTSGCDSYSFVHTQSEEKVIYKVKFTDEQEKQEKEEKIEIIEKAYYNSNEYPRNSGIWHLSNGAVAFCGQGSATTPKKGLKASEYPLTPDMCQNYDMTRKILYYGYNGPENQFSELSLSGQLCVTNEILQKAVSGKAVSEIVGNKTLNNKTIGKWWEVLETKPTPPNSFLTFMVDYSECGKAYSNVTQKNEYYQKLFYGIGPKAETPKLKVTKSSTNTEIVENNPMYSLKGCVYALYKDEACKELLKTLEMNEIGTTEDTELEPGDYFIKEEKSGKGYHLDNKVYPIHVEYGQTTCFNAEDVPMVQTIQTIIQKVDADGKMQGNTSLGDAQFKVNYYASDKVLDAPTTSWILKSDPEGNVKYEDAYKVSGDPLYKDSNGKPFLPLGLLTVQEIKAPKGYMLDPKVYTSPIKEEIYVPVQIPNEALEGCFEIHKVITDGSQSEIVEPEHGAKFICVLKDYYEHLNQDILKALEYAKENGTEKEYEVMVTGKDGIAKSNQLVYGSYVIQQVELGVNGQGSEMLEKPFYFDVTEKDGKAFVYGTTYDGRKIDSEKGEVHFYINDIPFQAYVSIVKKDAKSMREIALNPAVFKIKMVDDKNNPIQNYQASKLKTNEDGYISIKVGLLWYDAFATNAQNKLSVLESVSSKVYNANTSEKEGSVIVPVPLVEGKYLLEEVKAPTGYLLDQSIPFEIHATNVSKEGELKTLEVVFKNERPKGKIVLKKSFEGESSKQGKVQFELRAAKEIKESDTGKVLYKKGDLIPGSQIVDGKKIKVEDGIYTLDANNEVIIEDLPLNSEITHFEMKEISTYSGYQLSTDVLEFTLSIKDSTTKEYVSKNNLVNKAIQIHTSAHKKNDDTKVVNSHSTVEFVDTVSYEGLVENQKYKLVATLMDQSLNKPILKEDKQINIEHEFIAKQSSGNEDVLIKVDGELVKGKNLVVFEQLFNEEGSLVASHEDIHDKNQTIQVLDSEIHTMAMSENGSHEQQISQETDLVDRVYLSALRDHTTYKLKTTLMDKETKKPICDPSGKAYSKETSFVYSGQEYEDVSFKINSSSLAGKNTVFFEELMEYVDGKMITLIEHKDFDDQDQEISFIDIKTRALSDTQTHTALISKDMTLKDTVFYEGLKVGQEYSITGTLMDRKTGEAILDANGNSITASTTFVCEQSTGQVDVIFNISDIPLQDREGVVFESLYTGATLIAKHEDTEDEEQWMDLKDMEVRIIKKDANSKKTIVNKDFEFSMFDGPTCKTCIKKAVTDTKEGYAYFKQIPEGVSYVKETKAPSGYKLSNRLIRLERKGNTLWINGKEQILIDGYQASVEYPNNPDSPNTGIESHFYTYLGLLVTSLSAIYLLRKRIH
ncbi:MAG: VaFE repeat-containing surface-anchored protein, partial [Firmicutes bacterium]|nr:VaFE repeat-containing surface-anchored protein [Bacillota bacterium]